MSSAKILKFFFLFSFTKQQNRFQLNLRSIDGMLIKIIFPIETDILEELSH